MGRAAKTMRYNFTFTDLKEAALFMDYVFHDDCPLSHTSCSAIWGCERCWGQRLKEKKTQRVSVDGEVHIIYEVEDKNKCCGDLQFKEMEGKNDRNLEDKV